MCLKYQGEVDSQTSLAKKGNQIAHNHTKQDFLAFVVKLQLLLV